MENNVKVAWDLSENEIKFAKINDQRNKVEEDPEAGDRSSLVNTEMNTLVKGDIFRFDESVGSQTCLRQKVRNSDAYARFVHVNCVGKVRNFYFSSITRVAAEVVRPTMEGMVCVPTGKTFAANRKNFDIEGEQTDFAKVANQFVSDKALAEALTAEKVVLKVLDKKQVVVARFTDNTRTSNQNLMMVDFNEQDEEKRAAIIEALMKRAAEAI